MPDNKEKEVSIEEKIQKDCEFRKANMSYVRIVKASKNILHMKHVYTGAVIDSPTLYIIGCLLQNNEKMVITNPSALQPLVSKAEYKQILKNISSNTWRLLPFNKSNVQIKVEDEKIFVTFPLINQLGQKVECHGNPMPVIVNMGEFPKYAMYIEQYFEQYKAKQYIIQELYNSFAFSFKASELEQEDNKCRFSIARNKSDKKTTFFITITDNNISVKAKRNNEVFNKNYSLKGIEKLNQDICIKVVIKIHYDICKEFDLTPFEYITTKGYIENRMYTYITRYVNEESSRCCKITGFNRQKKGLGTAKVEILSQHEDFRIQRARLSVALELVNEKLLSSNFKQYVESITNLDDDILKIKIEFWWRAELSQLAPKKDSMYEKLGTYGGYLGFDDIFYFLGNCCRRYFDWFSSKIFFKKLVDDIAEYKLYVKDFANYENYKTDKL